MTFVNCTTFFCEWLSLGFSVECQEYSLTCDPCHLDDCPTSESPSDDCWTWECHAYPDTTTTTTTTPVYPYTTTSPSPVHPATFSATSTGLAVLSTLLLLICILLFFWRQQHILTSCLSCCHWSSNRQAFLRDEPDSGLEDNEDGSVGEGGNIPLLEVRESRWTNCCFFFPTDNPLQEEANLPAA
jgi:hypothetical protein